MERSDNIDLLITALAKAQAEFGPAKQSQKAVVEHRAGGSHSYQYATLADVWDVCRKPLSNNNLAVIQSAETTDGGVGVTTMLAHGSGQWVSSRLVFGLNQGDPQAIGSVITYGRRYGLTAIVGIAPDDDDGAAAQAVAPRKPQETVAPEGDHWCAEHQTYWFKTAKMRSYAHPIGNTGIFCNEPHDAPPRTPPLPTDDLSIEDKAALIARGRAAEVELLGENYRPTAAERRAAAQKPTSASETAPAALVATPPIEEDIGEAEFDTAGAKDRVAQKRAERMAAEIPTPQRPDLSLTTYRASEAKRDIRLVYDGLDKKDTAGLREAAGQVVSYFNSHNLPNPNDVAKALWDRVTTAGMAALGEWARMKMPTQGADALRFALNGILDGADPPSVAEELGVE